MDSFTHIIFFVLPFLFADVSITSQQYSSSSSPTTTAPKQTCECLNTATLKRDLDKIFAVLNQVSKPEQITVISSELAEIKEAVQDKTCECTEGSMLIQLEERANKMIDEALQLSNASTECACSNRKAIFNISDAILARLDKLLSVTNIINNNVVNCEEELKGFETKLDIIIDNTSGNESLTLSTFKHKIDEILDKVCKIQNDGCKCEDKLKELYDRISARVLLVLDKTDVINNMNESKIETILKILEKIDGKQEQGNSQHEVKKEKEVKPWEISEKCKEELLCDYESCIKDALHDLDDWFKFGTWNRMPEKIKKVMIILYCKVGFKSVKTFKTLKVQLEAGKWKDAAAVLGRTRWARRMDPVSAKDLILRLQNVNEKMAFQ